MQCVCHEHEEALGICYRCDHPFCRTCMVIWGQEFLCSTCRQKEVDLEQAATRTMAPGGRGLNWVVMAGVAAMLLLIVVLWKVLGSGS